MNVKISVICVEAIFNYEYSLQCLVFFLSMPYVSLKELRYCILRPILV